MQRLALVPLASALLMVAACDETPQSPNPPPALPSATPAPAARPSSTRVPASPVRERAAPPAGFVEVRVAGVTPANQGSAVLLVDEAKRRALVVFVGETEALSIQLRLEGTKYKRPLTHDLLDSMLAHLGARVHSVRVDRLDNDIFYGVVALDDGQRIKEFDSRTSDGVALALGSRAPVFVAKEVLERAAIPLGAEHAPAPGPPDEADAPDPIAL